MRNRIRDEWYPFVCVRISNGTRKIVVTSLKNILIDVGVVASEQTGDIECFSFNISAISLPCSLWLYPYCLISCVGEQKKRIISVQTPNRMLAVRIQDKEIGIQYYPCLIRTLRKKKQDEWCPFISTLIASVTVATDRRGEVFLLAVYFLVRFG